MTYKDIKHKFPEHWFVIADEDNYKDLENYRMTLFPDCSHHSSSSYGILPGYSLLSAHHKDNSHFFGSSRSDMASYNYKKHVEISYETFLSLVQNTDELPSKDDDSSENIFDNYYSI